MVTLRTRHFPKIRLGVVTQVAKSTLLELRKSAGNLRDCGLISAQGQPWALLWRVQIF
jgi:hypothetical protein